MAAAGQPAGACLGFVNKVVSLHTDYPEHNLLVAFDAGPTFRNDLLSSYKGSSVSDDCRPTCGRSSRRSTRQNGPLGVPYVAAPKLRGRRRGRLRVRRRARAAGNYEEVVVVSSDKDLLQLVLDGAAGATSVSVLLRQEDLVVRRGGGAREARRDARPSGAYHQLAVDASDDVPGVLGVGSKWTCQAARRARRPADAILAAR